jgi:hypothetical protein
MRFAIGYTEKGSPFAAEQGIPYLATLHLVGLTTLGVTELPTSTNAYAGPDELLQSASASGGGGAAYEYLQVCQVTALWSPTVVGIHGAVYQGWSAAAIGGGFNYALPGCGTLTLTMSGFPALGSLVGASLSGVEGTPVLLIGTSIPPIALCSGCLLGIDPFTATIIQADSISAVIPPEGGYVNGLIAVQGADIGSTSGCSGSVPLSLSEEVIITIL